MGFLRWEPLPSRHWSLHIPLPLPATGATSREVWPPGAIKFATLQHPALALATLCCWSSLCYCSERALAPGCQAPCAPCCPVSPASQLISPQFPGRSCCCCQLVSQSTGESGCRIPGAQEGRSQDTQCLQQRLSEANIKGGAGAAGLGTAQLRAAGNMHTCISQGRGGEGGGRTAGFPLRPVSL